MTENKKFTSSLNKYYKACGCSEGTLAGIAGTGIAALAWSYQMNALHWSTLMTVANCFIIVSVSMAIGKIIGLRIARRKLAHVIREILLVKEKHTLNDKSHGFH